MIRLGFREIISDDGGKMQENRQDRVQSGVPVILEINLRKASILTAGQVGVAACPSPGPVLFKP